MASSGKKIGLALSGGAARGFAHIGVIKVLQEHEIDVDLVTGTSVGAIVGALLAGGYDWKEILEVADSLSWPELVAPTFSGMGLVGAKKLQNLIAELLGDVTFEELKIPFRAVAVDISKGTEVVFSTGSVARAVRASAAVPGIFEPLIDGDQALVDGGVANNLPVALARDMGADAVIAVDLNAHHGDGSVPVNLVDVIYRSLAMLHDLSSAAGREQADILIQPDLSDYGFHDLSQSQEMLKKGEEAATTHLSALQSL